MTRIRLSLCPAKLPPSHPLSLEMAKLVKLDMLQFKFCLNWCFITRTTVFQSCRDVFLVNNEDKVSCWRAQHHVSAHSKFKNEQKLPKMVSTIRNFFVLHFGENFMKIQTKIAKLQMPKKLYKNVNENMFLFTFLCKFSWFFIRGQLKQQIVAACSFTQLISYLGF